MANAPTAPGVQLAHLIERLRTTVGWNTADAAAAVGIGITTYRKWEAGTNTIPKGHFKALLADWCKVRAPDGTFRLNLSDDELRQFLDLRDQAEQPVWWSEYGLTENVSQFLGFESMARRIRVFEANMVFGPLQTQDYARALIRGLEPPEATDQLIDRKVQLRLERQHRVYGGSMRPQLQVILDEQVIRRRIGGTEVMRGQLQHLITGIAGTCELRILPVELGPHPGLKGAFWLFDFTDDLRPPAVYVESVQRNFYIDRPEDTAQASVDFGRMWEAALGPDASRDLIGTVLEELDNP